MRILSDLVGAALGCGQVLVGIRCPHVEQLDVPVTSAVLSEGVVDVRGLAALDIRIKIQRIREEDF